jgi:hypothetical protein
MSRNRIPHIRAILRDSDGLTAAQLAQKLQQSGYECAGNISRTLETMPDTYRDRYIRSVDGDGRNTKYAAVWCAVAVPEDCPRPEA